MPSLKIPEKQLQLWYKLSCFYSCLYRKIPQSWYVIYCDIPLQSVPFCWKKSKVTSNAGQNFIICLASIVRIHNFLFDRSCNCLLLWFLLNLDSIQIRVSKAMWTNFSHYFIMCFLKNSVKFSNKRCLILFDLIPEIKASLIQSFWFISTCTSWNWQSFASNFNTWI